MTTVMNLRGLRCPQPVLRLAIKANTLSRGEVVQVHADCPSFADDIRKWCEDSGKVLVNVVETGGSFTATVQL